MTKRHVAIIGAGVSGLTAIKTCREYGLEPVCFERFHDIGGLWYYKPQGKFGEASVMKSTIINTSKETMAFSDFPPPDHFANYMHNEYVLEYFRLYAEKFGCIPYIKFKTEIIRVKRSNDYEETGNWDVTYKEDGAEGTMTQCFNAVMICTGHHAEPYIPDIPGLDRFRGIVKHSHEYKEDKGDYAGKIVAVIGMGNSGGDIAVELGRPGISKQVYLVTRHGAWLTHRVGPKGLPADIAFGTYINAWLIKRFPGFVNWILAKKLSDMTDHEMFGIKPDHKPLEQHNFVQDDLPNRILSGGIAIKPEIVAFEENSAIFADGTKQDVDAVIMATGFSIGYPFLEDGVIVVKDNEVSLYKYMVQPALEHPESLCVIGLVQPNGSTTSIAEQQCRVFAEFFTGNSKLPSTSEMAADIAEKKDAMRKRFLSSRRHTIQVDWVMFMHELAAFIGADPPSFMDLILTDPALALALYTGPVLPYHFRLRGPHNWPNARETIITVMDRVKAPMKTNRVMKVEQMPAMKISYILIVIFIGIIALYFWRIM